MKGTASPLSLDEVVSVQLDSHVRINFEMVLT